MAGYDLTGMTVTVYPAGSAPSFVFSETDDSSALINTDDGGESFVLAPLDSPLLADAGIEQLVLQHSSTDDVPWEPPGADASPEQQRLFSDYCRTKGEIPRDFADDLSYIP